MRNANTSTRFIRLISLCTARNPEVVAALSPGEQGRVAFETAMLAALAVLIFAQWFSLIGASDGAFKATVAALVFTVLYIGYDYVLAASLERQSVLGGRSALSRFATALRVGASVVGATVLVTAWALDNFGPEIDNRNRLEAAAINAPVRAEYEARLAEQKQRRLAPLDEKILALNTEQSDIQSRLVRREEQLQQHQTAAADALREAQRQSLGVLGAVPGQGPLHRYAMTQRESAERAALDAADKVAADQVRLAALRAELPPLEAARTQALRDLADAEKELEAAMTADPRWVAIDSNFLSRFRGLIRLTQGEDGLAVLLMTGGIGLLFISLEIAYLLTRYSLAGMTYAQRDLLRERRDFEVWAQAIYSEIRANQSAYRRQAEADSGAPSPHAGHTGSARCPDIRVVELKTGTASGQEG